jgi:hypothetical protein
MSNKIISFIENEPLSFKTEDSGAAMIADTNGVNYDNEDSGLFVRIQSWDESLKHPLTKSLEGKKVKITIEVLD